MQETAEVLIVGAGAAGLSAARELALAGRQVLVLEARNRIGGRIFTQHDPLAEYPIEHGAEFIHGRPPESLAIVERAGIDICQVPERHWFVRHGHIASSAEYWSKLKGVLDEMRSVQETDLSFQDFLDSNGIRQELGDARQLAESYVQGFHAADPKRISVIGLNRVNLAADRIDGNTSFRIPSGYDQVAKSLFADATRSGARFQFGTVVQRIDWQSNQVSITALSDGELRQFGAKRALVTLPLGVLQASPSQDGAVNFAPTLPEKDDAIGRLAMGPALRITFRFRDPFWKHSSLPNKDGCPTGLSDFNFIHAPDESMPTWWTRGPEDQVMVVGWTGGPGAMAFSQGDERFGLFHALESLAHIFAVPRAYLEERLEDTYTHNWQTDPFSRGAYSYVPVGGLDAAAQLSRPVENTLFFAGEATNAEGHAGTVHGAIASGIRAAGEILTVI